MQRGKGAWRGVFRREPAMPSPALYGGGLPEAEGGGGDGVGVILGDLLEAGEEGGGFVGEAAEGERVEDAGEAEVIVVVGVEVDGGAVGEAGGGEDF
jgi:hypothetical protein